MAFKAMEPRTIICPVCKKMAKEAFFGMGFPGFLRLMDIVDEEKAKKGEIPNPVICPECKQLLLEWLNGNGKIILDEKKEKK